VRGDAEVFAVTEKERVPLPEPLEAAGVIHEASSLTGHVHPAVVVTVTLLDPAVDASVIKEGVTEKLQTPCCVTLTVLPATASCAVREEADVFAVTERLTVPLPDPLATPEVSHVAFSLTDHGHPEGVVTAMLPEPAPDGRVSAVGVTLYVHVGDVNRNWFETGLRLVPPGPLAAMRAS